MRKRSKLRCLGIDCDKPQRSNSCFCSDKCGSGWAEVYIGASEVQYCDHCGHGEVETSVYPCAVCGHNPEVDWEANSIYLND